MVPRGALHAVPLPGTIGRPGAPAIPAGLTYSEETLSLINNTLLPGNMPTANVATATFMTYDNRTNQVLVEGINDNSIVVVNASTDVPLGGFPAGHYAGLWGNGVAIDPLSGRAYVADQGSHVVVADPRTGVVLGQVAVGSKPVAVAIDNASHRAFIVNYGSNNVSVLDTQTLRVIANMPCGSAPESVSYVAAMDRVFVGNWGSSNLTVFNATSLANTGSISVVSRPWAPTYDPDNHLLYVVGENSGGASVVNITTYSVVKTIPMGTFSWAPAVLDVARDRIFLLDTGSLTIVDGTTNTVMATAGIGTYGTSLIWDPLDHNVYTTDGTSPGTISVLNETTGLLVSSWNDTGTPQGSLFNPALGEVFIANQGVGTISVLSSVSHAVVNTLFVSYKAFLTGSGPINGTVFVGGACPGGLAELNGTSGVVQTCFAFPGRAVDPVYNPLDHLLYVSDGGNGVRILNLTTGAFVGYIGLPNSYAWEMAVDPRNDTLFVTNPNWGNTSAIDLRTHFMVHRSLGGSEAPAYDPEDGSVWVSDFSSPGLVYRFNATTYASLPTLTAGAFDDQILYDPLSHAMYVANSGGGSISVFNASTGASLGAIQVGGNDYSLAYDPIDGLILSAGAATNNVSVINARTNLVALTLPTGAWPRSIAFSVRGGVAAISDQNSGAVTLVHFVSGHGHLTVSFSIHPTSCPITFNGTSQASGSSGQFLAGTYSANAPWCGSDWAFQQWNATGGVSVSSPSSLSPTVTISANGTLTAYYAWAGPVPVTFHISPSRCGTISINGSTQADGSTANLLLGGYSIGVNPCSYYVFHQWNSSGGVSVLSPTSASSSITLTAPGSLTAWFVWSGTGNVVPRYHVTFHDSPATCPIAFNGTSQANLTSATFPEGNYTAWAPACAGYSFSQWITRFVGPGGTYNGGSATNPALVDVLGNGTVNATYWRAPAPVRYTLSFAVNHAACSPVQFNGTSVANGSSSSFLAGTYTAHAPACVGFSFADWEYQPTGGGMHLYTTAWANISIWANGTVSAFYDPPVSGPLTASLVANTTTPSAGGSATLTPSVAGGVSPYSCLWSLNGTNTSQTGCGAAGLSWSHPGTYTYRVWATDATSQVAGSNSVAITVRTSASTPPLVAFGNGTVAGYPGACGEGGIPGVLENVTFTGSARDGVPPYSFSWTFGDGSPSASGRNVTHGYATLGDQNGTLTVTDAMGHSTSVVAEAVGPKDPAFSCPARGVSPAFPFGLTEAGFILLVVLPIAVLAVLIPLVLLWRRRRGRGPPPPEPGPAAPQEERPPSP